MTACDAQVQAWRAHPSTTDRAKQVWSALGSTNTIIARLLNALATTATASAGSTEGKNFEDGAKVGYDVRVATDFMAFTLSHLLPERPFQQVILVVAHLLLCD